MDQDERVEKSIRQEADFLLSQEQHWQRGGSVQFFSFYIGPGKNNS